MKVLKNPARILWPGLVTRPQLELDYLDSTVRNILHRVRTSGDLALKEFALQFDRAQITELKVSADEIALASNQVDPALKASIAQAAENIRQFHRTQIREESRIETMPGVSCWRRSVPIERVGLYIPGGSAPLFSTVLMLAIPAQIAGCKEIVLCSPAGADGTIHPAIMFAAQYAGVSAIFKVGGAQAIAAMAYGTSSIPRVNKIFGPGNQYVTKAKQIVNLEGIAIDMPAGPSEVLVVADHAANPDYVAADLLAQAEHGPDSQVVLLTNDEKQIEQVSIAVSKQLASLPRKDIAAKALEHSLAIFFEQRQDVSDFSNAYAPEHLIINTRDADDWCNDFTNAGSVFLGPNTPESAGDYASGTNHTLPTNGAATAYSGVSLDSFVKFITYQRITREGLSVLGPVVETMAAAELLEGHRRAVSIRTQPARA